MVIFFFLPLYAQVPTQSTIIPPNWSFLKLHLMKKKSCKSSFFPHRNNWNCTSVTYNSPFWKGTPVRSWQVIQFCYWPAWMPRICCVRNTGSKKNTQVTLHKKAETAPKEAATLFSSSWAIQDCKNASDHEFAFINVCDNR